jgi:hypothetical protein
MINAANILTNLATGAAAWACAQTHGFGAARADGKDSALASRYAT